MKRPTEQQFETAQAWLVVNSGDNGDNGEAEACKAVADWLAHESQERMLRAAAREGGVSVAALRRKLEHSDAAK